MLSESMKALPDYFAILDGRARAKYLGCRALPGKLGQARSILSSCRLCERRCGADRVAGELGFCRVLEPRISSEFLHFGEEPELVPSYTIFFAGCTFSCVFCQNWDISQNPKNGAVIRAETLASMINDTPARNVNWVGGEPTPNLPYILEVLTHVKKNIPQVWNSNMYLTKESMELLNGVVDVYLTDFKYGNNKCALKYSNAPKYWEVVTRNHALARKQAELIIRHLVLPGHVECCTKPALAWIAENLENVRVNIMDQYHPKYKAREFPDINRKLDRNEFKEAYDFGKRLGINVVE